MKTIIQLIMSALVLGSFIVAFTAVIGYGLTLGYIIAIGTIG